ncbi:DNA alkylation repair protein [Arthrobacter sp.]|uniref:DNA alkylation repair protein n=1 Tax=Arthrobacter sp. TaxID=1667 RepID=UPI00289D8848|nr:DNA alkylation repair protein [Arthrobacter sp.]
MDDMLGPSEVAALSGILAGAAPGISWEPLRKTGGRLAPLSLRSRTDLVADALVLAFGSYPVAASAYRLALADPVLTGWILWPVTESVTTLALQEGAGAAFDDALDLLAELTPRLTSEFAIRRLLEADPGRALERILPWTGHPDPHVRRLASEGTRPYLPWAIRVPALLARPEATLPILDALHNDPSEYVRRSAANHLNDLARHAPEQVVETAGRWQATGTPGSSWVIRHGLRTLVKKGHPGALALMGFDAANISVTGPYAPAPMLRRTLPSELVFGADLTNDGDAEARLAVDYVVHYVKARGSTAPKVFKLAVLELAPGESRQVSARHALRQMTTRQHYPGVHAVELQVNGIRHGRLEFELTV